MIVVIVESTQIPARTLLFICVLNYQRLVCIKIEDLKFLFGDDKD